MEQIYSESRNRNLNESEVVLLQEIGSGNSSHSARAITILYEKGVESSLPMNFFLERYAEAYIFEIKSFIDSLINNSSVSVNGKDGLESLRIGLAAKKSLQENRPVKLNEIET